MRSPLKLALAFADTPLRRKAIRYSLVSVVNVSLGQLLLAFAFGLLHWSARTSNVFATAVATIPAYFLYRGWIWKKTGRSHFLKEVVPIWAMGALGLLLSTWVVGLAESTTRRLGYSRLQQTIVVMIASAGAFGAVWVARFLVLEGYVFVDVPDGGPRPQGSPGSVRGVSVPGAPVGPSAHVNGATVPHAEDRAPTR